MSALTVYQNRLKAIRLSTAGAVGQQFDRLPDLHKEQAAPFARKVAPMVAAGQLAAAKITNAYISRQAGIAPIRIDPKKVTGAAARNGVDLLDEYERPFGVAWSALSNGSDLEAARAQARNRVDVLALADVWLAMRATTALIDDASAKITGWVRVADAGACDLCSAADGMPTEAAADMAGHPGCGCTQEPTFADTDPSEPADLEAIDVHEHDELGPVLYEAGQSFAE